MLTQRYRLFKAKKKNAITKEIAGKMIPKNIFFSKGNSKEKMT